MSGGVLSTASTTGDGIDGDAGYIQIDGGTININLATADTKAIKCDSIITVNGGNVTLTVPAAQGKGFKTKQTMTVNGGTITANMTGAVAIYIHHPQKHLYTKRLELLKKLLMQKQTLKTSNIKF